MSVSQTQFDPDQAKLIADIATLISLNSQLIAQNALLKQQASTPDDLTNEDIANNTADTSVVAAIAASQAALASTPTPPAAS